jgi:hypothetical protein
MGNKLDLTALGIWKVFWRNPCRNSCLDLVTGKKRSKEAVFFGKATADITGKTPTAGNKLGYFIQWRDHKMP